MSCAEGAGQFDYVVHVVRLGRIGEVAAARHQVVRVLLDEERVLTVGIVAHLDGVGGTVAPDAVDAVNRKDSAVSAYRYDSSLWRCNYRTHRIAISRRRTQGRSEEHTSELQS